VPQLLSEKAVAVSGRGGAAAGGSTALVAVQRQENDDFML
jgi:hypothetical protein